MTTPRFATSPLILNVDDYAPGRYTRSRILKQAGFNVHEAATGEQALTSLTHRPDLVLLDVNLPDLTGFEVCRRIKGNMDTAGIVVLHLSASSLMPSDHVAGLEGGADGYLVEPIDPTVLIATIKSLLRMRKAEEALRKSNETLRTFTDILAHDLREPIRAVRVYTDLLEQRLGPKLKPDELEMLGHLAAGGKRMSALVESVIGYSRAIYDVKPSLTISAQDSLDASLAELALLIEQAGAQVICETPLPQVQADSLGLASVFSNLISNSIKYRSAAPPVIRISAIREGAFVLFSVADNGIGIDSQYHARIFNIFSRLHGHEYSGAGIGLSLCRRLIESMGGSIWVDSQTGGGAVFYFTLPPTTDVGNAAKAD